MDVDVESGKWIVDVDMESGKWKVDVDVEGGAVPDLTVVLLLDKASLDSKLTYWHTLRLQYHTTWRA